METIYQSNITVLAGTASRKDKPEANVGDPNFLGNTDYVNGVLTAHCGSERHLPDESLECDVNRREPS